VKLCIDWTNPIKPASIDQPVHAGTSAELARCTGMTGVMMSARAFRAEAENRKPASRVAIKSFMIERFS
jgi:hypothetical protein